MYEIEATVTLLTPNELKLTANWPLRWLEASGSIEVQRKLEPGETLTAVKGLTQHSEVGIYQRAWPNLAVGPSDSAMFFTRRIPPGEHFDSSDY
jgi:hypothetical protein